MTTERATYVYAIVEHPRTPRVPRRGGVPGARPPRVVPIAPRRWAVVADVPQDRFAPDAVRARLAELEWVSACALGHERVVEALLECTAVAPMRLFAVFRDEAALLARLRRSARRLDRTLAAVRGRVECGLRVWVAHVARETTTAPATGTAFLASRAARVRNPTAPSPAQVRGTAVLLRELSGIADRTRRGSTRESPPAGAKAVRFLIARSDVSRFTAAVRRHRRALRALGLEVALLGPYPAYSFV